MSSWTRPGILAAVLPALLLVATATSSPRAQRTDDLAELQIARLRAARVERERWLQERWETDDEAARLARAQLLLAGRAPGAPRKDPLPLSAMARAARWEAGRSEEAAGEPLQELVDSLDVQVTPGFFGAREAGRGEAMTVELVDLWDGEELGEPQGGVEVRLWWLGPDGQKERARREVASVAALERGFELFIRPPASTPGTWHLVLEVAMASGSWGGVPVPVECVAETDPFLTRAQRSEHGPLQRELAARAGNLWSRGLRSSSATRLADWAALAAGEPDVGAGPLRVVDLEEDFETEPVMWELAAGSREAKGAVLLLADADESSADLLSGPRGRAWERFAAASGRRVLATASTLPGQRAFSLDARLAALRAQLDLEELVLVARGDLGRVLPRHLAGEGATLPDALVLCETRAARVPIDPALALDSLRIESEADEAGASDSRPEARRRSLRRLRGPDALTALRVPELLASWLAER